MPGTAPFCGNSGFSPWFWGSAHLPVCSSNILLLQPCLLGQLQCFLHPHLSPGTTFGIPSARVGQIRCLWRMPGLSHPVVWTTGACAAGDLLPGGGCSPLPGQNLGGTESPNMPPLPPLPCRAGSRRARGRRAAAFPTLHNFHFNGFSSFFFLCCMSASIFHS